MTKLIIDNSFVPEFRQIVKICPCFILRKFYLGGSNPSMALLAAARLLITVALRVDISLP